MKQNIDTGKDNVLCLASEKGKIIINKCIQEGIFINTLKLERLLILVHGNMLVECNKPFFKEQVVTYGRGLVIEEVDKDFLEGAAGFDRKYTEYITLLEKEEEIVDRVIRVYGDWSASQLNHLSSLKKLEDRYAISNFRNIVPNPAIKDAFKIVLSDDYSYKKELNRKNY